MSRPHSCIYRGWVRHRRFTPVRHEFRYGLFLMYLDLDELPALFDGRWLWSARRAAPAWFRRGDHLGDPGVPLGRAVRELVERRTGTRPGGPIRLLTHLRYFGHGFNPASFYFCYDETGERVQNVVAEVHNTPWRERHCYVLDGATGARQDPPPCDRPKRFHVSPFLPMDMDYRFRLTEPGSRLTVQIDNRRDAERVFDATLALRRREISGPALAAALLRYPLMTARVVAAIHYQALRLWLKRVPVHPHPKHLGAGPAGS